MIESAKRYSEKALCCKTVAETTSVVAAKAPGWDTSLSVHKLEQHRGQVHKSTVRGEVLYLKVQCSSSPQQHILPVVLHYSYYCPVVVFD